VIRIENISKIFNKRSANKNRVLKSVSFDLPDKGLVAIFGKSGSGKTTLLNIIGGLDKQDEGNIIINGENTAGKTDAVRNAKIGYIFQNYYLEKGYTIAQILRNQMLIAGFKDESEIKRRTEAVLKLVEMERFKNKQGDALSGGQQQRVAIARAIIKGSDVILADEPTGNLDAENTVKVMDILKEISKTQLVVLVTHEISLIKKYADSHIKIVDGELRPDEEITEEAIYQCGVDNVCVDGGSGETIERNGINIELYGEPLDGGESVKLISHNGSLYIQAGKNVTVLNEAGEKRLIFKGADAQGEEKPKERASAAFEKSNAKRNGRLFNFKSIFKQLKSNREDRVYSTANIFKQIFVAAMAVVMCFFVFSGFNAMNATINGSALDQNDIYVDLNAYTDLRQLDGSLYSTVGFFETEMREGSFSYSDFSSLSGITARYSPKAIEKGEVFENIYGKMPKMGEVLVSRALVDVLKKEMRIDELQHDSAFMLMMFENDFRVSGIVENNQPAVWMNKADYVNFLGVYSNLSLSDYSHLFFAEEYDEAEYSAEIVEAEASLELGANEVIVEINRNSLYKMMSDVKEADRKKDYVNNVLAKEKGLSTKIQITGSRPMYVQKFEVTRDIMTTDIRVYVSSDALRNIFVFIEPKVNSLSKTASGMSGYYFAITAAEQSASTLNDALASRGINRVDLGAIYEKYDGEAKDEAAQELVIYGVVLLLLYLIYYFLEKSASIKNTKEYGIYRALGVNKSNLIFKESVLSCVNNLIGYTAFFLLSAVLMTVRFSLINTSFGSFLGLIAAAFVSSSLLMVGISVIPYLFVLFKTPAQILAKYDI
jgi:ABC-type lipoprotein export system ATPase subunit